jgi:ABC-type antimicrobial peptide transport system permease subunit
VLLVGGGIVLGLMGAMLATPLLGGLPIVVAPPGAAALAAGIIVGIAGLAACLGPAWRVARTRPVAALRVE